MIFSGDEPDFQKHACNSLSLTQSDNQFLHVLSSHGKLD
jgi:hypothetical protein